jgi:hypothetical protein
MDRDWVLWLLGFAIASLCLMKLAHRRWNALQSLLNDYVSRQQAWNRRRRLAADLMAKKREEEAAS